MDEANGGDINVKEGGEVLAYHLHDRDSFENYLLNNTKLEKGSTDKHNFGKIYVEDERKFINLNLLLSDRKCCMIFALKKFKIWRA